MICQSISMVSAVKFIFCLKFNAFTTAAKSTLTLFIAHIREMIADPEKLQGVKLTKEEKVSWSERVASSLLTLYLKNLKAFYHL